MGTSTHQDSSPGIRTEVVVGSPGACPVAAASVVTNARATGVNRSVPSADGTVVEEFEVDGDLSVDDATPVFETDAGTVYRFDRLNDHPCVCEQVEEIGVPVSNVYARDGRLVLSFYADTLDDVRDVVRRLRDGFGDVSVGHLRRAGESDSEELVFVDRSNLTERQQEVLEAAYEMGYFDYPKGANAGEVASQLGISSSTFIEHLSAAQSKVLASVLEH